MIGYVIQRLLTNFRNPKIHETTTSYIRIVVWDLSNCWAGVELVKLFVNKTVYNKVHVDDWLQHNDTALQVFGKYNIVYLDRLSARYRAAKRYPAANETSSCYLIASLPGEIRSRILKWACQFCLSVCSHILKTIWPNFTSYCACYFWQCLGPPLAALRYVIKYFRFCGWHHEHAYNSTAVTARLGHYRTVIWSHILRVECKH